MLKDDQGQWITDSVCLKYMAREFYLNLYSADATPTSITGPSLLLVLSHANRRLLNRPVYLPEVHKALFDMRPNKAPGPDGFLLYSCNNFGTLFILRCES